MAKLIDIQCPKCAAPVHIAADATSVACRYCGTTSVIDRGRAKPPRQAPAASPHVSFRLLPVVMGVLTTVGVVTAVSVLNLRRSEGGSQFAVPGVQGLWSGPAAAGHFADRPMLAEINGDGVLDVVGKVRGGGTTIEQITAFDGSNGAELWHTEPLTKDASDAGTLRGVLLGRVISVDALGKAQAYDLRTGNPAWSALLGEKGSKMCEADGTIVIETTDEARHGLDPATGKKREVARNAACKPVFSSERDVSPGYRIIGWPEMRELGMPSLSDIDGITAHRGLVVEGDGPRFMLGQRSRGSSVAMVAAVDAKKKVLWMDIVPGVDPLTTDVNTLGMDAAYIDGKLIVPYAMKDSDAGTRMACFDATTGQRLWDVQALPKDDNWHGLAVSPQSIFFTAWFDAGVVLSLETGELRYKLGG
jgi:outer membrane protein assembly factor BamB